MTLSFLDPIYLLLLALLPPLAAVALLDPRVRGARRWLSLGLRALLTVALVLSLAGAQLNLAVGSLTTIFLIDSSDSITPGQRAQAESFVEQALREMPEDDRAAIIVFGQEALIERAPDSARRLALLRQVPQAARTDIEEALNLGLALFPADTQKRIVLLSDGGENVGRALQALRLLAVRDIPIEIVDLGGAADGAEAALLEVRSVSRAREGQAVDLIIRAESTVEQSALLRVRGDNVVLAERQVQLPAGTSSFTETVVIRSQGYHQYSAELLPAQDTRRQNNEAATLVQVEGPPRVLIVARDQADAANLQGALTSANLRPEVTTPAEMPTDLPGLVDYEAVVLINVPERDLPDATEEALRVYVHELGRGLTMVGGERSFGVGGYAESPIEAALPVYMDVRNRERRPDVAVVFVIDRSGSMDAMDDACRCHSNLDIAKEAVVQATDLLTSRDQVGIVAFDGAAYTPLHMTTLEDPDVIEDALSAIDIGAGTDINAGLVGAEQVFKDVEAPLKHVILLTDGYGGDEQEQRRTVQRLFGAGITVTTMAIGASPSPHLGQLALDGGGRFYAIPAVDDVPQVLLDELLLAVGTYIVEESFTPAYAADSPIMADLQQGLPPLYGYNGTTEKETARVILVGLEDAPLLAQWQYGLGRSVAWTSDMKGKWARDWVSWPSFPRFASQLVSWTLPTLRSDTVTVQAGLAGTSVEIDVSAEDADGAPLTGLTVGGTLVHGDGQQPVELREVAPGRYVARVTGPQAGTYLINVGGVDAEGRQVFVQTGSVIVPYSPEYRQAQANPRLLDALADGSGGRRLERPEQAFEHNLAEAQRPVPLSLALLLLAALLLPLDIAVRRLAIGRRHLIPRRAPKPKLEAEADAGPEPAPAPEPAPPPIAAARPEPPPEPPEPDAPDPSAISDPLERLRAAKQRNRRK